MADVSATWAGKTIGRVGGAIYDFGVEREWLAKPAGRLLWGTDARLLFDSIGSIGDLPDGSAVLDVPCGGGVALRGVRPNQDIRYVAADISTDMLDRARGQARRLGLRDGAVDLEFTEANIEHLPFAGGEFDLCVSYNGLHCLPDPAAAVREIARCLKPGGRLRGDTIVVRAGLRQDLAIGMFRRAGLFGAGGTMAEVEDWLAGAGLRVERLTRSGAVVHFDAVMTP